MKIVHDKLVIPEEMHQYLREVIDGKIQSNLVPSGWNGIMIYHPATGKYYATKSVTPMLYEAIVREKRQPRYAELALGLRKMLDFDPQYQFFLLPTKMRPLVEGWMAQNGYQRVTTMRGEAVKEDLCIFQVYSEQHKVVRYVSAPCSTPHDKIIQKANMQLARWLRTQDRHNEHERNTMRIALNSKFTPNSKVFSDRATIRIMLTPQNVTPRNISTYIADINIAAIKQFIQDTVSGNSKVGSLPPFSTRTYNLGAKKFNHFV